MTDSLDRNMLYLGILTLLIGSVLSGFALIETWEISRKSDSLAVQSMELSKQALDMQNISSNFKPSIVPYYAWGVTNNIGFGVLVFFALNIGAFLSLLVFSASEN